MKKFLFVAAAVVASMVFTGCINEDDTYKKLQPVEKGINIYNWTSLIIHMDSIACAALVYAPSEPPTSPFIDERGW